MYDFKRTEGEILNFWKNNKIFQKSLAARENGKKFVFFEGPPTANGLPHIGHFLTRVYKDLYGRYKTMRGFYVLRKAGWDTHGLPVEIEVEKELGFKNKKDIEEYGIGKFNEKAKESVWKYKKEWEEMTRKMGFWIDLDDPYVTYESKYIETLWHILHKIWKSNLLYAGHKVLPYCTRCGTPLSSHEVAQEYKTVIDKSVYIKFRLKEDQKIGDHKVGKNTFVLAWTTTPWTLPGNVALAVGAKITYVIFRITNNELRITNEDSEKKHDSKFKIHNSELYIVAKDLLSKIADNYEIIQEFQGSDLVGLEYEALFDIKELKSDKSYKIYDADFVSTGEGTGVVHTAVMYGEDDYVLGTKLDLPKFHTVNENGKFQNVSKELNGKYVKDKKTEDIIISYLTTNNLLLTTSDYEHEYPFCWRCHSPLLYYAKGSWFIKTSAVKEKLIANNSKINWHPEHIKEGRFGQWLKEVKDWALSRERYWGTPLPIWECNKCKNVRVVGSVEELEKFHYGKRNKYYLLRHSLSTRNELGDTIIISSDINSDKYHLTEEGKKLAEKEAEKLEHEGGVDVIFTSPFLRTKETAEIVGKRLHIQVHKDERLREIKHSLGCEGNSHNLCPLSNTDTNPFSDHDGGESWHELRARLSDFIKEIESRYSGKRILIVSHGDPIVLLRAMGKGLTEKEVTEERLGVNYWLPKVATLYPIDWRSIPRNNQGELDLHRPFIDDITLRCSKCRASMKKIPDLMDVWFDSGAMPFAQWHWPFEGKKMFKEQFPADYISEGIDQTRGWFYTLLAISTFLGKGNPYKNVTVNGFTLDEKGKKMSKSLGNVMKPDELMDAVGADASRWYFYTVSILGENVVVTINGAQEKLRGFINTLDNCLRFYELYSEEALSFKPQALSLLDKWIFSRFNGLTMEVTDKLDKYDPTGSTRAIERYLIEDLSNWWLRRSRKRKESLPILRYLILELAKLISPFTPFIADEIFLKLRNSSEPESVHLSHWPAINKKLINLKLEEKMDQVRNIVAEGLALRKEKQIKVRQPLRAVKIKTGQKFEKDLEYLIKEELNVKEVEYIKGKFSPGENLVDLDLNIDEALRDEGYVREFIIQLQDMRKDAGYKLTEKVNCQWHSDDKEISGVINKWQATIKEEVLLHNFVNQSNSKVWDVHKEVNLSKNKKVWAGIKK